MHAQRSSSVRNKKTPKMIALRACVLACSLARLLTCSLALFSLALLLACSFCCRVLFLFCWLACLRALLACSLCWLACLLMAGSSFRGRERGERKGSARSRWHAQLFYVERHVHAQRDRFSADRHFRVWETAASSASRPRDPLCARRGAEAAW